MSSCCRVHGLFSFPVRAVVRGLVWRVLVAGVLLAAAGGPLLRADDGGDAEKWQVLTDQMGRTIRAEVLSVDDTTVKIRRDDGREFTVPLAMLSDADQARLKATIQAGGIKLMSGWKMCSRKGEEQNVIGDLNEILGGLADPSDNTKVRDRVTLYRDVKLLDPISVAETKLGLSMPAKSDCILPGFPHNSFYIYRGSGDFDGYENITLLTDTAYQVVAVQLSSSRQTERHPYREERHYLLYDMLDYTVRALPVPEAKVGWWVERGNQGGVMTLDSAFWAQKGARSINGVRYLSNEMVLKYTTQLYLPTQLIALVLFNIQQNW